MHVLSRVPNRQLLRILFLIVGVFHMPIGLSLFYVNTTFWSPAWGVWFIVAGIYSLVFAWRFSPGTLSSWAMVLTIGAYLSRALAFPVNILVDRAQALTWQSLLASSVWMMLTCLFTVASILVSRHLGVAATEALGEGDT